MRGVKRYKFPGIRLKRPRAVVGSLILNTVLYILKLPTEEVLKVLILREKKNYNDVRQWMLFLTNCGDHLLCVCVYIYIYIYISNNFVVFL